MSTSAYFILLHRYIWLASLNPPISCCCTWMRKSRMHGIVDTCFWPFSLTRHESSLLRKSLSDDSSSFSCAHLLGRIFQACKTPGGRKSKLTSKNFRLTFLSYIKTCQYAIVIYRRPHPEYSESRRGTSVVTINTYKQCTLTWLNIELWGLTGSWRTIRLSRPSTMAIHVA